VIQQSHLTTWQAHAPWDKRSKIEQDLRLSRAVAAIFSDDLLSEHLALRGGTVLHKGHLAPAARYSEDLDLVLIKSVDKNTLDARLRATLAPVLGKPSDSVVADAWLAVRNVLKPSKILRTTYKYVPIGLRYPMTVKVEVNLTEQRSLYPFAEVQIILLDDDGELTNCSARSYDIHEMLGTKMRALMQRTQGRDLFDLYHAANFGSRATPACPIDGSRVIEAFNWYLENEGTQMERKEAEHRLAHHLEDRSFRNDMRQLLRSDYGPYDVDEAAALVSSKYLTQLK
jgi:predicted nucleotidyltransferase component of viral defense system